MQAPVKPAPDLVDRIAWMIDRQIVDLLGLARRSGSLTTGFEKVDVALRTGKAVLLIEAKDAGADGRAKLARHTLPEVEIWAPLTAEQLGRAIGRNTRCGSAYGGLLAEIRIGQSNHPLLPIRPNRIVKLDRPLEVAQVLQRLLDLRARFFGLTNHHEVPAVVMFFQLRQDLTEIGRSAPEGDLNPATLAQIQNPVLSDDQLHQWGERCQSFRY
jgi:ribosomal protein L7Ae-like RNA K-turn-binding protein